MRVFMGCITKNLGERFDIFKSFAETLMTTLSGFNLYVYENNSTDSTPQNLKKWSEANPRVHVKSEVIPIQWFLERSKAQTYDNQPCRLEIHAVCRNKVLEMMEADGMGLQEDDVTIVMDPDIKQGWPVDFLLQVCQFYPKGVDALFANGLSLRATYYDAYTYFDEQYPFGMELIHEDRILSEKHPAIMKQIPFDAQPIPVLNAFGGLAVYRSSSLRGSRYSGIVTKELHEMNLKFIREHPDHPYVKLVKEKPETHYHGAQLGLYLFDKELFYRNNAGYNYPVVCEHVPLHASMRMKGFDKMFILPPLLYVSDHY
jgi:hypothetical protein